MNITAVAFIKHVERLSSLVVAFFQISLSSNQSTSLMSAVNGRFAFLAQSEHLARYGGTMVSTVVTAIAAGKGTVAPLQAHWCLWNWFEAST